jgi:hypothetical protein
MVRYLNNEEFKELMDGLKNNFNPINYNCVSNGKRLIVNDKVMKGFQVYENMPIIGTIEEAIKFISSEIQIDIDLGRIVPNK